MIAYDNHNPPPDATLVSEVRPRTFVGRLLPRHFKIIELILAGHDDGTIAQMLDMARYSISQIRRSPLVQAELTRRRRESDEPVIAALDRNAILGKAKVVLEDAAEKAAQTQVHLLEAEDESIKLRASNSILDRVFGKAEESRPVIHISAEQVQLLNIALQESTNGHYEEPAANRPSADAPEDQRGDVQAGAEVGQADDGHRSVQEQAPDEGLM